MRHLKLDAWNRAIITECETCGAALRDEDAAVKHAAWHTQLDILERRILAHQAAC